ncbi:MAG: hypothetical protein J6K45_02230 [Clostridia bacterium]|nr:hypothetical protein [Clostridia bacterium]MBP3503408.1 hypothetical protein [Clostridia bacterium]
MNKTDIKRRVNGLNEYMLSDSDKQLLILTISSDYTYNKAIAIVNREDKNTDWYSVDDKNCFKTWAEIDAFIDGICKGKNTNFKEYQHER